MENQTLGQKAVEEIIELIKEKNYAPGDKLPTEKELSELLGVSRNMVREALRVLVSRNLVTIRQGAGTFLSDKAGVVDDPFGFSFVEDKENVGEDRGETAVVSIYRSGKEFCTFHNSGRSSYFGDSGSDRGKYSCFPPDST